ncbi:hypothetical protein [Photobacterium lutimaris]|uniref:Lipoprotein n=1 Tax=Photobacterium lutimaris TaxID=388278 RepID=A0A2T3IYL9_9GAMM|nr:hypothetical protein [Photobacterium lutimaris]PSU33694.1 hypothetical protein C9I99_13070 [Photobacterium lutimaris]TDR74452.1 hypothetical protein DFP78_10739 [Photobacterium lutimaris]
MFNRELGKICLFSSLLLIGCSATKSVDSNSRASANQTVNASIIAQWVDDSILAPEGLSLEQDNIRYLTGSADLNNDGVAEHFVLIQDSYFCGSGGCTAAIFDQTGNIISQMSVVKPPVLLTDSTSNGWQDFMVWSNGAFRLIKNNGVSYPSNPSLEPSIDRTANQQSAMAKVIETELYQQDGYDITPFKTLKIWAPANVYDFTFKHYGDPHAVYHADVDMTSGKVDIKATASE